MTTTALAQIIGPVMIAAAIGFIAHPKFYKKILKDFEANQGLIYFTGILIMVMGLLIVNNHNIWEWSAAGVITLVGWSAILKGATFLIVPNLLFKISNPIVKNGIVMKIAMIVLLAAGGYLSYIGYWL
ncbi:MAG: hypothetical protein WCV72_01810 [Patescibacteria group bacterium]|jgi:hypothetical protein